jgi:hypothetical protein
MGPLNILNIRNFLGNFKLLAEATLCFGKINEQMIIFLIRGIF